MCFQYTSDLALLNGIIVGSAFLLWNRVWGSQKYNLGREGSKPYHHVNYIFEDKNINIFNPTNCCATFYFRLQMYGLHAAASCPAILHDLDQCIAAWTHPSLLCSSDLQSLLSCFCSYAHHQCCVLDHSSKCHYTPWWSIIMPNKYS